MFPIRDVESAGWVVYTLIVVASNYSGIAGGLPLIVLMGMFNFTMKAGITLSTAQIMISSLVRMIMKGNTAHPLRPNGKLMEYPILTMMFPMITVGSSLATYVSPAISDIYLAIGYAILVLGISIFSFYRLYGQIKTEAAAKA
jgi:uncharacterized membrane protein YfcA